MCLYTHKHITVQLFIYTHGKLGSGFALGLLLGGGAASVPASITNKQTNNVSLSL